MTIFVHLFTCVIQKVTIVTLNIIFSVTYISSAAPKTFSEGVGSLDKIEHPNRIHLSNTLNCNLSCEAFLSNITQNSEVAKQESGLGNQTRSTLTPHFGKLKFKTP